MATKENTAPPVREDAKKMAFKKMVDERVLYDPTDIPKSSFSIFDKATLREYMQNPVNYYKQLRNLSRYLYTRSAVYARIINDNATLLNPDYRVVVPPIDLGKKLDEKKRMKAFNDTLDVLENMNLRTEVYKIAKRCWIEDVFYGVYYYYKDSGAVILPIDPDYCQITGVYPTGDFSYELNMDYFSGKDKVLELWGEPFTSMMNEARKGTGVSAKWVRVPDEYCVCMKINLEDYSVPIPPYTQLFASLIDLEDLKEISSIADEQNIYKLLAFVVPMLKDAKHANEFAVDLDVVTQYYMKVKDALPDFTDAIISPIPVEPISFDKDASTDISKVENAAKNIMKTSGHIVLADNEGAQATRSALIADSNYAIGALLPQLEGWVNRFISYKVTNPARVKYMHVTEQTREQFTDNLIKTMNYGLPLTFPLGALAGFSEKQLISMAKMGEQLDLDNLFSPKQTSSTLSSKTGRTKSTLQTTDGEASEEKRDNAR